MYYNGDNEYEISLFLQDVHKSIQSKYQSRKGGASNVVRARQIESFLQLIKRYNNNENLSVEDRMALKTIYDLNPSLKAVFKNDNYKNLDAKELGDQFEIEVNEVIQTIFNTQNRHTLIGGQGVLGGKQASYFKDSLLYTGINLDKWIKELYNVEGANAEKIRGSIMFILDGKGGTKFSNKDPLVQKVKEIEQKIGKPSLYTLATLPFSKDSNNEKFIFAEKQGKTDVTSPGDAQLNFKEEDLINIKQDKKIMEGINALRGANLSLKAYKANSSISIGNTNPMKAYFSLLTNLGYNYYTNSSSFLHSINLMYSKKNKASIHKEHYKKLGITKGRKSRWNEVKQQIYFMRFVYELTGAGQKYSNKELKNLKEVDFIVLNETNSKNIKVKSTSQILSNMFNLFETQTEGLKNMNEIRRENPFEGGMYILSSAFYR